LAESSDSGFFAGVPLGTWFEDMQDCLLVTVTEKRTRQEIDALVKTFALSNTPASTIHA
jgi:glycine dehydrogenase subunit 1